MNVSPVLRNVPMMLRVHRLRPGAPPLRPALAANVSLDQAREQLRVAAAALSAAFRGLTRETRSIEPGAVFTTAQAVAMLGGLRLDPTSGVSRISASAPARSTASAGGITTGRIEINGKTVTVDVERDTLATLVERINRADAGVTARFDAATNTLTVSNAGTVAAGVERAVGALNEALAQLAQVRGAPAARSEVAAAVQRVIGALGEAGARGFSLGIADGALRLSVDRARLARSLGEGTDPGVALGEILERFTRQIPATPPAAPAPRGRSIYQLGEEVKAQLVVKEVVVKELGLLGTERAKSLLARDLDSDQERRG